MPSFSDLPPLSLSAAGLLALADLSTIPYRTILHGASYLDILTLAPGLHNQQSAPSLAKSEYPAAAALTTGYVFRVENEGTIAWLQSVSKTARLTTIAVSEGASPGQQSNLKSLISRLLHLASVVLILSTIVFAVWMEDYVIFAALLLLITVRAINTHLIITRSAPSWHGAPEPGVQGDLLVLLSQDRWVRLRGSVDAIKTVTSGQWLRDLAPFESALEGLGRVLVYASGVLLAPNATLRGDAVLIAVLMGGVALLGVANMIDGRGEGALNMKGCECVVEGRSEVYKRRRDLADELIEETGEVEWAKKLGMVNQDYSESTKVEKVTM